MLRFLQGAHNFQHPSNKLVSQFCLPTTRRARPLRQNLCCWTTANIAYCHCAPVCRTGSRAREIPLPPGMEHLRAEPLRDKTHPLGLPDLCPNDAARVHAANQLYFLTLCVAFVAARRNFILSVENPSNAYFWLAMQVLAERFKQLGPSWFACESTHFQACEHGGLTDKWTCWYGTKDIFQSLRALCTHNHPKTEWRPYMDHNGKPVFPTKAEAAYPELLSEGVTTGETECNRAWSNCGSQCLQTCRSTG